LERVINLSSCGIWYKLHIAQYWQHKNCYSGSTQAGCLFRQIINQDIAHLASNPYLTN
jgi:hypothetical protein